MPTPPPMSPAAARLLAAFRGIPPGATPGRGAARLDSVVEVLLEKHRIGQPRIETLLLEAWPAIVGQALAERCKPARLEVGGRLLIAVDHPTLRAQLEFRKAAILRQCREIAGPDKVRELAFRAG